jgi:hypothetical protein
MLEYTLLLFLFVLLLLIVNNNIIVGLQTCCDSVEILLGQTSTLFSADRNLYIPLVSFIVHS